MVIPGYPQTLRSLPDHIERYTTTLYCSCCNAIETNVWTTKGVMFFSSANPEIILSPETEIGKFIKYNQDLLDDPNLTPLCLLN